MISSRSLPRRRREHIKDFKENSLFEDWQGKAVRVTVRKICHRVKQTREDDGE